MEIIAHRGYWNKDIPGNSALALQKALKNGYGFEADIRDYMEKLVISHNVADIHAQDAEEVFKWLNEYNDRYCFAINIKADGLKSILKELLVRYNISNYFCFDMSIPQMVEYREMGLRFFSRQSEYEPQPCMYENASGVWIDGFFSTDWITKELLEGHLKNGKQICLVSPELHGNPYKEFWVLLKKWNIHNQIMLCTDYPDEAKEFFYGK